MRIGMMLDMYKPNISGITNYVAINKRWLEQQGHTVFVFTFGDEDYEDDELHVIRSSGIPVNVHDTGFHLSFRLSSIAQKKVQSMDVVHVHHPFLSGPLALLYCKPAGIPVVYTNHTRLDLYAQHYLPAYLPDVVGEAFLQAYLPTFCQRCDLVISPSPGIKTVMEKIGVTKPITVIPNGIDLSPFQNPPRQLTRAALGLPPDGVVVMYLGRLNPEKNLAFLLRAFFGVAAACPTPYLAIVGDGPELDNLRDQAQHAGLSDRVKFYGKADYAEVPDYLALADVFVTASQTEVHPLSLIEAMAAGLPALGVLSPGVGETMVDDVNGFLCPPDDLAVFTAKLMRLVLEPETRQRFAQHSNALAQQYDISQTAPAVLAEYERLNAARDYRRRGWIGFLRQWLRNQQP